MIQQQDRQPAVIIYYHRRLAATAVAHKGRSIVLKDSVMFHHLVGVMVNQLAEGAVQTRYPECGMICTVPNAAATWHAIYNLCIKLDLAIEVTDDFGEVSQSCWNPVDNGYGWCKI